MNNNICMEWLKAAELDLESIKYLIVSEYLTPVVAFHAQQAVEKSLKALLEFKKIRIPKIHKLQTLVDLAEVQCDEKEEDLLIMLDNLYIDARYPGDFGLLPDGKPTLNDAQEFYNFASETTDDFELVSFLVID
ncbi:MAG: HEPN domain-containing protein [Desulfamplus sp.]|nr:HEPN domain-containing protein [Desulfamplus sp.]